MSAQKWQIYTAANPTVERIIPDLAKEIGLNESIVLMQLAFWIKTSNNVVDGVYWTYQTMQEMQQKAFPYWSVDTIRRIIHNLQKSGYILIGQHNKRKGDNTQWYALEPDKLSALKSIIVAQVEPEQEKTSTPSLQVASTPSLQVASPPLQDRTALPETPTEIRKEIPSSPKAKGVRAANPEYNVIAALWNTDASGIIVNLQGLLFGTKKVKGAWKDCELTPYTTPDELRAFAVYAKKRMPPGAKEIIPTAPVTVQKWFCDFRAERAKKSRITVVEFEAPVSPMDRFEQSSEGETA